MINGSPHPEGNTYRALSEVAATLQEEGVESQIIHIGNMPVSGCISCYECKKTGDCAFTNKAFKEAVKAIGEADGLIIGSPVYFGSCNGGLTGLLDRLFFSHGEEFRYKPAAAVVVCRRGGASAAFDQLNKYFTINCMPVVSSTYWNQAHGWGPGQVADDAEGMATMRNLARNMAWMLRCIACGPKHPTPEKGNI